MLHVVVHARSISTPVSAQPTTSFRLLPRALGESRSCVIGSCFVALVRSRHLSTAAWLPRAPTPSFTIATLPLSLPLAPSPSFAIVTFPLVPSPSPHRAHLPCMRCFNTFTPSRAFTGPRTHAPSHFAPLHPTPPPLTCTRYAPCTATGSGRERCRHVQRDDDDGPEAGHGTKDRRCVNGR